MKIHRRASLLFRSAIRTIAAFALIAFALPIHSIAQGTCTAVGPCTRTATLDEYRHKPSGVHFYTACEEEKLFLADLPALFEQTGRRLPYSDAPASGSAPLIRFYLKPSSSNPNFIARHFYTVIGLEVANLGVEGFSSTFIPCNEGERGRAFEPQSVLAEPFGTDPRIQSVSTINSYCQPGQIPVWRVIQKSPEQHRLSTLHQDYLADRGSTGADDEGIRICLNAPWANARSTTTAPAEPLSGTTDREATVTLIAPDSVTALKVAIALPPNVQPTGYTDALAGACTSSGTAGGAGVVLLCNLPASATLTRTGKIMLRALTGYDPAQPGRIQVLAAAASAPDTAMAATSARACTGTDRPQSGCSVASFASPAAAAGLPNFTIGSISLISPAATASGGTGTLRVPITTASAADAGRPIRIFSEAAAPGSGPFAQGGDVIVTLPANGSTLTFDVPVSAGFNPADLRACVTTPELASGFRPYEAACGNPASHRRSGVLSSASFGTPPAASLFVGVYTLPVGTVGSAYVGSFYCTGPAGLACSASGLPVGLATSCGGYFAPTIDCVINGTPTVAGVQNVTLRATAPGLTPVSRSEVIDIRPAAPPPSTSAIINLGPPVISDVVAGSPNRFTVSVTAQSDPAASVNMHIYVKETGGSAWAFIGGQNGVPLSVAPQTITFSNQTTTLTGFAVRVCAFTGFAPPAACASESPENQSSGVVAYTTSGPINVGPPPALIIASWASQPPSTTVGAPAAYTINVRSQNAASPASGPLHLHIQIPSQWAMHGPGSPGCTQSGQRITCPVLASGTLSATTPVAVSFAVRPLPGAGGVSATLAATVNSSATPPATVSCTPPTDACIVSDARTPAFYDLRPQSTAAVLPAAAGNVTLTCDRDGSEPPPPDATCGLRVTYTDASIQDSPPIAYTGSQAVLTLCGPDAPGTAACSLKLTTGKTVQIMRLTATDGAAALDNNTTNNVRVVYDVTPPPPPTIVTTGMPPNVAQGASFSGSFYCEGSITLESFACSVAGLPAGLTQSSCTATTTATTRRLTCPVTGTPTSQGVFNLTYSATASNATGPGSATGTLTVTAPVTGCTPVPGAQRLEIVRPGDERLRQRLTLANGTYYIELAPHPGWRTGPDTGSSSYFRYEGMHPLHLDRQISVSKCPGDVSADDETLQVLDGDAGAFGTTLFFYGLPASAAPVRAGPPGPRTNGLPGLIGSTTWYLNIRQTRCEDPPGVAAPTCGLIYDVIP